jgi:hypothetical protein
MSEALFLVTVIGLLYLMAAQRNKVLEERFKLAEIASKCPPHKWVYVKQPGADDEFLKCENCKKFPGTESNEGEEL